MIELRKKITELDYPDKDNSYESISWDVVKDGVKIQGIYANKSEIHSYTNTNSRELSDSKIQEFPENIVIILEKLESLSFWSIKIEISKNHLGLAGVKIKPIQDNEYLVKFVIKYDLNNWKEKYSFQEYRSEFSKILGSEDIWSVEKGNDLQINDNWNRFDNEITSLTFHNFLDVPIYKSLEDYLNLLKKLHLETVQQIESKIDENLISFSFNFPNELKTPCEQYLLYFAQFLQDLGINATSNLKEEAGKVLFSVTPTDDVEALDKIREALAVYLNLPSSPIGDIEYSENFALMRLQQQVRNLQHAQQMAKTEILSAQYALNLAQQNIDNQNRIIVQQNSMVENLNKVIEKITSNSIMTDSLDKKDKEDFEEICEGLRVGESKWLRELTGIGLSSGKFIKAIVKNTFGKDEKKSILGLDKDE